MALSYYSNRATQTTAVTTQEEELSQDLLLPPELLNFHDNFDTCIDTLFSQNNLYVDAYTALSPSPLPLNTVPSQEILEEEACFDHYYSKRIKIQENYFFYPEMTIPTNYNNHHDIGFVPNPPLPPVFNEGSNDNDVKKASQQSIAARIRRRKITDKTQELGKLIPGGQKMNTAEMFRAAFKYIKLLQAQLGLAQLMQEENDQEGMYSPELEALVTSPLIQEKLYSADKCLVPTNFVKRLTQKPQLQSNPQLIKDLIKLT